MGAATNTVKIETALETMNGELGIPLFPHRTRVSRFSDFKLVWHAFSVRPLSANEMPMSACGKVDFTEAELPVRMPEKIAFLCAECVEEVGESWMRTWQESGSVFLKEQVLKDRAHRYRD